MLTEGYSCNAMKFIENPEIQQVLIRGHDMDFYTLHYISEQLQNFKKTILFLLQ